MHNDKTRTKTAWQVTDVTKMALVTAVYVTITLTFNVLSFGVIQLRIAEMFNYLPLFNKRYIWAVTLGVAIANLASPLGWIDVVVGSVCTLLVLVINQWLVKPLKNLKLKMVITAMLFAFSMFTVAGQLTFLYQLPFFTNWLIIGLGELASMTVGGILIYWLSKKIDFSK